MSTTIFLAATFMALAMLAVSLCRTRRLQQRAHKHDSVLFPFCQLRRDIIAFLYENVFEKADVLSREEYASVRRLLDILNDAIRNYNRHKTVMFNLRKVIKYIREYRHVLKQMPPIDVTGNAEIQRFHQQFEGLLAKAFVAYTPLIRSELALRIMFAVVAYRIGKARVQYAIKIASDVREIERRYGAPENDALVGA
ncbi:MAG: hypothetical protein MPK11_04950 [Gammaproteobacteria bacterium]|nr:hypothetical protein [Gammaproteobacteria bacterium]MDA7970105.1 hypothetical protein [Gammaproteobacteria bacterium]MDA7971736.1 hypothetical protein [Gammaproteobacteria bacterium]